MTKSISGRPHSEPTRGETFYSRSVRPSACTRERRKPSPLHSENKTPKTQRRATKIPVVPLTSHLLGTLRFHCRKDATSHPRGRLMLEASSNANNRDRPPFCDPPNPGRSDLSVQEWFQSRTVWADDVVVDRRIQRFRQPTANLLANLYRYCPPKLPKAGNGPLLRAVGRKRPRP